MFDDLFSQARGKDADLGIVVLSHPSLKNPHCTAIILGNFECRRQMSEITKVLNSNESLPIDENLLVTIGSIDLPKGQDNPNKLPMTSLFGPKNSVERKNPGVGIKLKGSDIHVRVLIMCNLCNL